MMIRKVETTTFHFTDLEYYIPVTRTYQHGYVVTNVKLTHEYEPGAEGGDDFFNYDIRGFKLTSKGKVDKREKSSGPVVFGSFSEQYAFLLSLARAADHTGLIVHMQQNLDRHCEREQKQRDELIKSVEGS